MAKRCKILLVLILVLALLPRTAGAASGGVIRDTEIEHYLLKIIHPMAETAGLDTRRIGVRVVLDPQYNAFVTNDDYIYINSGLLLEAENMLEVAGVIAHEIGHKAERHVVRRGEAISDASSSAILGTVAAVGLAIAGSPGAAIGVLHGSVDQAQRRIAARSRADESVADEWAIRLMTAEEYSLRPLTKAMRKIGNQRLLPESRQSDYYLSHPHAHERSAVFQDHITRNETTPLDTPEWMLRDFARLQTKLRAWTQPPRNTLAAAAGKDDIGARFARAIAFYRLSDIPAARDTMAGLVADYPDDPYLAEFYGDILLADGAGLAAAEQYENAILLLDAGSTNPGQILLSLGRAYLATDDEQLLPASIIALEMAVRFEPGWAHARRQLGIAYGRAGRLAEADLTLAGEALMLRDRQLAASLAKRAAENPDAPAHIRQLALDILAQSGDS